MKKLVLALAAVLVCMAAGVTVSADEAMVKVGLRYGSSAPQSAEFEGEYGLYFFDAATGDLLYSSKGGEKVSVSADSGFRAEGKFAADIEKMSVQAVNSAPITYDSNKYRGYFLLDNGGGKSITVINVVHMDQYLYSVLGREMSPSFPLEALKAQAICAKNYVLGEKGRHNGFDVCNTTHCQVYSGMNSEAPRTVEAADAVSGMAAYYGGKIVPLYFFATSGGITEDVKNVWGMEVGYLRSVSDPYEPKDKASKYTWSTALSAEEIKSRLKAKGIEIGDVTDISVDMVAESGRVLTLTFHGTDGDKSVNREACRTVIGTDKLYSQNFTVTSEGGSSAMMAVNGGVCGASVLTANGVEQLGSRMILSGSGIQEFLPDGKAESFVFNGRGYGHGVGMSQWGAYGMAEAGFDFKEILKHYFAGIEIN